MASPSQLVQYVCVRRDLPWGTGALIAQACHAATAAIWASRESAATRAYCDDADAMHKVVLEAPTAAALTGVAAALTVAGIPHKLWVEQPEGVITALATAPGERGHLKPHFAALKLMR